MQILWINLLQNGLKVIVEIFAEPASENRLNIFFKYLGDVVAFPLENKKEVHEFVFPLHILA